MVTYPRQTRLALMQGSQRMCEMLNQNSNDKKNGFGVESIISEKLPKIKAPMRINTPARL